MYKTLALSLLCLTLAGAILSACSPVSPMATVTPSATLDGTLRPYPTATVTSTPLPTDYVSPTPSPTVTPTPTPVYYQVLEGDDMYSIGWRFGLSPEAIMTANPTVNPRAMGIGTSLLIPITPEAESTATPLVMLSPTTTPRFSALKMPDCYPDALGGLWCFVLVESGEDEAFENISGVVTLQQGEDTWQEVATMPLNLLPTGKSIPLIAYFQPPTPSNFTVTAQVDFFLPVMPDDGRYLAIEISDQSITFREDGRVAVVTGDLLLSPDQPQTRYLWVNATAFDEAGHVVAVRRWDGPSPLSPGERMPFELFLYSMGEAIDRVDLLVEAQPVIEVQGED